MSADLEIRESTRKDIAAIESLYPQAFPEEDLLPLVRDLLARPSLVISLVAVTDSEVSGHAAFTKCVISGSSVQTALLGPLAVMPLRQRQGIGSALVRAGLEQLRRAGVSLVFVLGDPAYYCRLGFMPETRVEPPYALPEEWRGAWQSQQLIDAATQGAGTLSVPAPWLQPALWAP